MTAPDRTHVGSGSGDYETPPPLGKLITTRYALNYDAFASHENALLPLYSTIEGTFTRPTTAETAAGGIGEISNDDGLEFDWTGRRVFCNPPYGRGILRRCVEKMIAEIDRAEIVVALLPVSSSSVWFRELLPHAFIEWLPYRVAFVHPPFKCSETCEHALGEPLTSPPGDNIVAEFRQPNGYAT